MKMCVISNPPAVIEGLVGSLTGVLEALAL